MDPLKRFLVAVAAIAVGGVSAAAEQPAHIAGPEQPVPTPAADGTLNLLTYNVGFMRIALLGIVFYQPAAFVDERFASLPEALLSSGVDTIALQEAFGRDRKETLAAEVRTTYPYAAWWPKTSRLRQSSGLMVLSKWPITAARYEQFANNPANEAMVTRKGFLEAIVELAGRPRLRVFDFHMTAGGNTAASAAASTKAVRAGQIRQVLAAAARPFDGATILLGDLNAGPGASDENYRLVRDTGYVDVFAAATGDSAAADHLTWDPRQLLIANGPRRHTVPRRIDHAFLPSVEGERIAIEGVRIVFKINAVPVEGGRRVPASDH